MNGHWEFQTRLGTFRIVPRDDGRFDLAFEGEGLGGYYSPEQALEDLIGGSCFWPSIGNPAKLDIPDDLSKWMFVRH